MSNQRQEEQSHPVAMLGCEWSMVCIHEANVLCVLSPLHNFGTVWKELSKEEQYSEQSTGNEDYGSRNKLRDVIGSEVLHITVKQPNYIYLVELSEKSKTLFCSACSNDKP